MTTQNEVNQWVERGRKNGATHLIVVCDTFDYEDYPVFVMPGDNLKIVIKKYSGKNMQKIMEIIEIKVKK